MSDNTDEKRLTYDAYPMSQILAYLRTSTDKQDLNGQRLQILDYARNH